MPGLYSRNSPFLCNVFKFLRPRRLPALYLQNSPLPAVQDMDRPFKVCKNDLHQRSHPLYVLGGPTAEPLPLSPTSGSARGPPQPLGTRTSMGKWHCSEWPRAQALKIRVPGWASGSWTLHSAVPPKALHRTSVTSAVTWD